MEMSEKPDVLVAAVVGLGSTLGRVITDSAVRLGTLVGKLDASLPMRTLVDGIDAVQDNQDIRHRASERKAGKPGWRCDGSSICWGCGRQRFACRKSPSV